MIPITTTLKGFGPYDGAFTVNWKEGATALLAGNGTGKSFLIEADFAAIYGEFPSRPGQSSLYDNLCTRGTGDGEITSTFSAGGRTYTVTRSVKVTAKTRRQTAVLIDEAGATIAGPKIADFDRAITTILPSREVALATWMAAQNRLGDFLLAQPADRRRLFGELLDFERLNKLSTRAKEEANKAKAKAEEIDVILLNEDVSADAIAEQHIAVERARDNLKQAEALADAKQREVDDQADDIARLRAANKDRASLKAEVERLTASVRRKRERLSYLDQRYVDCKGARDTLPSLQKSADRAKALHAKILTMSQDQEKWHQRQEWEAEFKREEEKLDSMRAEAAGLESVKSYDSIITGLKERIALAEQQQDLNAQRRMTRTVLAEKHNAIVREIRRLEREIQDVPSTPGDPEACERCPLMSKWTGLPEALEAKKSEKERIEAEQASVLEDEDCEDIVALNNELRDARDKRARRDALTANIERAVARLQRQQANEPEPIEDPRRDIEQVRKQLLPLEGAASRLADAKALADSEQAIRDERHELANDLQASEGELGEKRARLEALPEHEAGLEERHQMLVRQLAETRKKALDLVRDVAREESRLSVLDNKRAQAEEKRKRRDELLERHERMATLGRAFGPTGIQPMLIDRAAPRLESIINHILETGTDVNWTVRIITQTANQDGSMREDLRVMVFDGIAERDVASYSGGEQALLRVVFRIAQALWQAEVTGRPTGHLRFDEALENVDPDRTEQILDIVKRQGEHFTSILFVTQDPAVAATFEHALHLKRMHRGVEDVSLSA